LPDTGAGEPRRRSDRSPAEDPGPERSPAPGHHAEAGQGEAVLSQAVSAYQAVLGSRLIACYALGSLALTGLCVMTRRRGAFRPWVLGR
jgi:hypothetical protein